jgi:predicted metal-dependent peptidase
MVTAPFPHLAGLVAATRVALDDRVPTMGVFASGRLVANPAFVGRLNDADLVFVLAHEMLHLALRTHDRAQGSQRLEFNYAHDYIINDILRAELGVQAIPANGLDMPGAREKSAEQIVLEMRRNAGRASRTRVWEGEATTAGRAFGSDAERVEEAHDAGDVLDDARERELFPGEASEQSAAAARVREAAEKALGLAAAMARLKGGRGRDGGAAMQVVDALRGLYRTPWEVALQRWAESIAPGERTFTRPSRRGAERDDLVLPGRRREGWILNVVLDTSASMAEELPRALGAIADFCDALAVDRVRLVQCDAALVADELLEPHELVTRAIGGLGGSDLAPALEHLAADAQVRAAIAITDGDVAYPAVPPPYEILWVLPAGAGRRFAPPYGRVLVMEASGR